MKKPRRVSVSLTDWQYDALEEIAATAGESISHTVRDLLAANLPRMLEFSRFLQNPSNHPAALDVIDDMEALLARLQGGAVAGDAGAAPHDRNPPPPPSSNTGANSPDLGNS